ncbi:Six-hairpin glycosidase-like protein [Chiua virens]|nr:Six-hairpin glycosidase-like protein [Chiua virens]
MINILPDPYVHRGRSGIDANTVLASTFQPCSDIALSNLKVYADSFRYIYSLNAGIPANAGVATSRYPKDTYYGGNPWYLTTFAVAEQLYNALIVWNKQGYIDVTSVSLGFFQQFDTSLSLGTYSSSSSTFGALISAVKTFADGFVVIGAKYTPSGGELSEEYNRDDGTPESAIDLTWSYASALTVFTAHAGQTSASWGAAGLTVERRKLNTD